MFRAEIFLTVALVAAGLTAQQTWVVDPNGAGQFTSLRTAIDTVAPGDTLVRGGSFGSILVNKSLHLVGEQPRPSLNSLTVVSGATVSVTALDANHLILTNCQVSVEDLTAIGAVLRGTIAAFLRCTIDGRTVSSSGGVALSLGSHATFHQCQLRGSPGGVIQTLQCTVVAPTPALVLAPGTVAEVANSTLTGAGPHTLLCLSSPGTNGLFVHSGGTALLSGCLVQGGGSVAAVASTGTVLHDRSQFTPPFAGGTATVVPAAVGQGAPPGGVIVAGLTGPPQQAAAMVAGLGLRPPVTVPEGWAWVDLGALVVLRIGLLDAAGAMSVNLSVPHMVQRGLVVTVQGVVQPAASPALVASVPVLVHVL